MRTILTELKEVLGVENGDTLEKVLANYNSGQSDKAVANQADSAATSVSALKDDFNDLLIKLKNAGVMIPDAWAVSVLACPTPQAMPTEETAANSGHASVSIEDTEIVITLDCEIADLEEADHGSTWGEHKWLGFGVRTGLDSIVGIKFTDDTGATAILSADDAAEATALGLSAGDFVLYIKAEDAKYLKGKKSFTLWTDGFAKTTYTMKIVETPSA